MSGVPAERAETASAVTVDETESAADEAADEEVDVRAHLVDVEDGCGCAEVWEHLSSGRGE